MSSERSGTLASVRALMRTEIVTIGPEATLPELARLLRDRGVSGVPVVDDDGDVLGMVSATDLLWLSDLLLAGPSGLPDGGGSERLEGRTVREIMTPDAFGIPPDAGVAELLEFFSRTGLHRALVLDGSRVVGIVTMTDLLGLLAGQGSVPRAETAPASADRAPAGGLRVREVMVADPVTLEPEDSLRSAADLLTSSGVGGAPVVSGRRVLGVVSLTDILTFEADDPGVPTYRPELMGPLDEDPLETPEVLDEPTRWFVELWEDAGADAAARFTDSAGPEWDPLDEHTVAEVMSRVVIGVAPTATVADAARLMEEKRVHRLLVLEDGALMGILTTWDVMRTVARGAAARSRGVAPG